MSTDFDKFILDHDLVNESISPILNLPDETSKVIVNKTENYYAVLAIANDRKFLEVLLPLDIDLEYYLENVKDKVLYQSFE